MGKNTTRNSSSDSDSDSDAPEAVALDSAKGYALGRERAVTEFHASTAKKRKEANKAREDARKAAADERKRKTTLTSTSRRSAKSNEPSNESSEDEDEDESPEDSRLRQRMERAMQQAEEEDNDLDTDEDLDEDDSGEDEYEEMEISEPEDTPLPSKSSSQRLRHLKPSKHLSTQTQTSASPPKPDSSNYLPESIFAAAKAANEAREARQAKREASQKKRKLRAKLSKKSKSKSLSLSKKSPKEVVIGTRIVRTLTPITRKAPALASDSKAKFEKQSRAPKGKFERRPVSLTLAVGKSGPPNKFVRR